jgi:hypothetical protein
VVKSATICMVLSLTISRFWHVHQLDVKNVFLHGTLSEPIYYSQPMGFVDPTQPNWVYRLNKSLYMLNQVPQAWYSQFTTYLLTMGFDEAKSDTSLFIFHHSANTIYLLLHVDDIVLIASSTALLQHTISALKREFAMKELDPLHHFGGSPYSIRQMDSSSLSVSSLSMSLSALASWTASQSQCLWTHMSRSPLLPGLLLLIRLSSGASLDAPVPNVHPP